MSLEVVPKLTNKEQDLSKDSPEAWVNILVTEENSAPTDTRAEEPDDSNNPTLPIVQIGTASSIPLNSTLEDHPHENSSVAEQQKQLGNL